MQDQLKLRLFALGLALLVALPRSPEHAPMLAFAVATTGGRLIVLNNCDFDGAGEQPDHANEWIDGAADLLDLEEIRLGRCRVRAGEMWLLGRQDALRFFDASGRVLRWEQRGSAWVHPLSAVELAALAQGDLLFRVEGCRFGARVRVCLVQDSRVMDSLQVEVAPLLFTPDAAPLEKLLVAGGVAAQIDADCEVLSVQGADPWLRDEVVWAYTRTPRRELPVLVQMNRRSRLPAYLGQAGADVGVYCPPYADRTSPGRYDRGGNVTVTPPTLLHPLGCAVVGSGIRAALNGVLATQVGQPTLRIRTDWLQTGHLDEIVAFLPVCVEGRSALVMVIADPRLAIELLDGGDPQRPVPEPLQLRGARVRTMGGLLDRSFQFRGARTTTRRYNRDVAALLDEIRAELVKELQPDFVLELPVLFKSVDPQSLRATPLTPNLVNYLPVGHTLYLPDPLLPEFAEHATAALAPHGFTVELVDSLSLHRAGGNLHCATNGQRRSHAVDWWSVVVSR